ncbi:MAG: aldehyde:ferredoxin oxidoreductase, partial [Deltaproteobacteria bacterium]|nr:aldehyde:ferredoxin oxidoreductase [Deltaproteobacteria bacterium]
LLGLSDPKGYLKLMDRIEAWALDVMSTGVVLAWATEAQQKGLITEKETNGLHLSWGDYTIYIKAVRNIIEQPNEFYKSLAQGVEHAAAHYGGEDFALAFGKNEMPGYHTGPGAHLGVLIGARHSHLDNAGYSIDQKTMMKNPLPPEELIDSLINEEKWRQVLSSLVVCFFARGIYQSDMVVKTLHLAGFHLNQEDLTRIGDTIYREKYRFKIREGFSFDNLPIPQRIFETPSPVKELHEDYIQKALAHAKKHIVSTNS